VKNLYFKIPHKIVDIKLLYGDTIALLIYFDGTVLVIDLFSFRVIKILVLQNRIFAISVITVQSSKFIFSVSTRKTILNQHEIFTGEIVR